jgi:hypothetical protein
MSKPKLSRAMILTLRNLHEGLPSGYGLEGMSSFGGHQRTLWALARRKLINQERIRLTALGRAALAEAESSK